ncbi:hypothetical protein Ahy_B05g077731 isoform B [Arachis hypogaea]|uniref:Uncharacterized protein n=1 Tax=Arachis hypogaea TaxID=3818 RepID=A0A444Z5L0_ARAHY|nr:hypothetical protein Ahy_B05g077731 isoform B [Arachis hypogaea]
MATSTLDKFINNAYRGREGSETVDNDEYSTERKGDDDGYINFRLEYLQEFRGLLILELLNLGMCRKRGSELFKPTYYVGLAASSRTSIQDFMFFKSSTRGLFTINVDNY